MQTMAGNGSMEVRKLVVHASPPLQAPHPPTRQPTQNHSENEPNPRSANPTVLVNNALDFDLNKLYCER